MQNYKNNQVDLSNCDKEPIHIIGRIQPHGFLLVLDKVSFAIEQVSQNISNFLPIPSPEDLLGKPLQVLLSENEIPFDPKILLEPDHVDPNIFFLAGNQFFSFSHVSEFNIILECEPYTACADWEKIKHNHLLFQLHKRLNTLETIESLGETVAEVVMGILDYDRVDIMQFNSDWHTEVIAENCKDKLSSYLNHHFPASDIPVPARALLLQKPIRQIPDVNAKAVEIIPYYNPSTGSPANILKSELRNPSEIHLEYVRNMGVAATISFSIIVKGQLWGIISCHNIKPAFINVWNRQLCDLITKSFADAIAAVQEKKDVKQYELFKRNEQVIITDLKKYEDLISGLAQTDQNLLSFTQSIGAALVLNKEVFTFGITPSTSQVSNLISWLSGYTEEKVYSTRELSIVFPEAETYIEIASGLLALEISRYNQEYLLFFKPEVTESRIWAGNPEKPTIGEGMRIHPRKSFDKWKKVIKGKSLSWSVNEIEITQVFVKDLTAMQLRDQATELRKLNAQLETTAQLLTRKNNQLNDFGFIMSHNLRAPINNIQGLYDFYKMEPNEANAALAMDHIQGVLNNMSQTISDLNIIIKTRIEEQLPSEEVNLEEIIQKERQNLQTEMEQTEAYIKTDLQVSTLTFPKLYIESILHNFISNALKYCSPDRRPLVLIKTWTESGQVYLSVSDNGLGMDLVKVGNKLFGLYKTFHQHKHAKGLGLYLTKIQIESLGGQVSVQSELNKGSTFTVSFSTGKN